MAAGTQSESAVLSETLARKCLVLFARSKQTEPRAVFGASRALFDRVRGQAAHRYECNIASHAIPNSTPCATLLVWLVKRTFPFIAHACLGPMCIQYVPMKRWRLTSCCLSSTGKHPGLMKSFPHTYMGRSQVPHTLFSGFSIFNTTCMVGI